MPNSNFRRDPYRSSRNSYGGIVPIAIMPRVRANRRTGIDAVTKNSWITSARFGSWVARRGPEAPEVPAEFNDVRGQGKRDRGQRRRLTRTGRVEERPGSVCHL